MLVLHALAAMKNPESNPYKSPKTSSAESGKSEHSRDAGGRGLKRFSPVIVGLTVDTLVLLFSTLILDGGRTARISMLAMIAHWLGVLLILRARRLVEGATLIVEFDPPDLSRW